MWGYVGEVSDEIGTKNGLRRGMSDTLNRAVRFGAKIFQNHNVTTISMRITLQQGGNKRLSYLFSNIFYNFHDLGSKSLVEPNLPIRQGKEKQLDKGLPTFF